MINNVVLVGRLTRDPELRRTNSGEAVTSFTLAVNRPYESTMLRKSETGVRRKQRDDYENFAERGTMEIRSDSGGLF